VINLNFKYLKPIALFLAIVVLFQCCVAYDKQPATIDETIKKNHKIQKRIKIEMIDGTKLVLDSIYYKENELYGLRIKPKVKMNNNNGQDTTPANKRIKIEVKIEEDKIKQIQISNISISRGRTVGLLLGVSLVLLCIGMIGAMATHYP
jgi:hypothetical protein